MEEEMRWVNLNSVMKDLGIEPIRNEWMRLSIHGVFLSAGVRFFNSLIRIVCLIAMNRKCLVGVFILLVSSVRGCVNTTPWAAKADSWTVNGGACHAASLDYRLLLAYPRYYHYNRSCVDDIWNADGWYTQSVISQLLLKQVPNTSFTNLLT